MQTKKLKEHSFREFFNNFIPAWTSVYESSPQRQETFFCFLFYQQQFLKKGKKPWN